MTFGDNTLQILDSTACHKLGTDISKLNVREINLCVVCKHYMDSYTNACPLCQWN